MASTRLEQVGKTVGDWWREVLALLAPFLAFALFVGRDWHVPLDVYLPFHSFVELFSVVGSALVFGAAYAAPASRVSATTRLAGALFLGVALLDCAHLFSYESMPSFVTPSSPSKAIYFWLAARLLAALAMLALASPRPPAPTTLRSSCVPLGLVLAATAVVFALVLGAPSALPTVYVASVGLTSTKVAAELGLWALYALAFARLAHHGSATWPTARRSLARAALLMTISELPFALYVVVSDGYNALGHLYKLAAALFVYQAAFEASFREPYLALAEAEARFRQLADNMGEVFWIREVAGNRVVYASAAFEKVYGVPPESLASADDLLRLLDASDRERMHSAWERQRRGEATTLEVRVPQRQGTPRRIRIESFPVVDPDGVVRRVVGISADITKEREAHDALVRAQRQEDLGRLAGGIAHDFNNLLTVILSSAELASREQALPQAAREDLEQIHLAADRARVLASRLLGFARRQPAQPRRVKLGEVVSGLCGMLRTLVTASIELSVLVEPGDHLTEIDPGLFEQVLINLVINAKDAMDEGGTLVISVATVPDEGPSASPGARICRVRVTDTGIGMAPEVAARVFEPFFTTKPLGKGTGLGLATSASIIKEAGGRLAIATEVGRGTTVEVRLPALPPGAQASGTDAPAAQLEGPAGRETVLLVDDEPEVLAFSARALRRCGYTVLEASNGPEALRLARGHAAALDLLVTDLVMPLMSGRELAQALAGLRPGLPVLFVSGYAGEDAGQLGHELLPKPYSGTTLAQRVRVVLDRSSARAAAG